VSFDRQDFRGFVSHVLREAGLHSPAAVELLLGTCAVETDFGRYRRQLGGGPGCGPYQMEGATWGWLRPHYQRRLPEIRDRTVLEMVWDDRFATIAARLRYLIVPEPLPPADDIEALARYWKRHYNTALGKGTVEGFIAAYQRHVVGAVA
jgi:hypothetical protein